MEAAVPSPQPSEGGTRGCRDKAEAGGQEDTGRETTHFVNVGDHLLDLLFLRLEAEGSHCYLELLGVDGAGAISIEQVESLADLLLLLLGELELLVLGSSFCLGCLPMGLVGNRENRMRGGG